MAHGGPDEAAVLKALVRQHQARPVPPERLDLVSLFLVALQPRQADLLHRIGDGPLVNADDLRAKGAFDATGTGRGDAAAERQGAPLVEADTGGVESA